MALEGGGGKKEIIRAPKRAYKAPRYISAGARRRVEEGPPIPSKRVTITRPGMTAYGYASSQYGDASLGDALTRWFQARGQTPKFTLGTQVSLPSKQELEKFMSSRPTTGPGVTALRREGTSGALKTAVPGTAAPGYAQYVRAPGAAAPAVGAQANRFAVPTTKFQPPPAAIPMTERRIVPGAVGIARGIPGNQAARTQVFPTATAQQGERLSAYARYLTAQQIGTAPQEFQNMLTPATVGAGVGVLPSNLTPQQAAYAANLTKQAIAVYGKQPTALSAQVAKEMGLRQESLRFEEAARYTGQALFGGFDTRTMGAFAGAIDRYTGEIVNPDLLPNIMSPQMAAALGISEEDRLRLYGDASAGYRLRERAIPPAAPSTTYGYGGYGGYGYGGGGYGGGGYAQAPELINWRIGL